MSPPILDPAPTPQRARLKMPAARMVVAGIAATGTGAFVLVWFQPQKLVLDRYVDKPFPTASGGGPGPSQTATTGHVEPSF